MKVLIVGGTFGDNGEGKSSGIIRKISDTLWQSDIECEISTINGGTYWDIENQAARVHQYELIIWMPNIGNDYPKVTPKKAPGSTMIVSKQIREDRTRVDAVTRIFNFGANAVIAITPDFENEGFSFELIDALDNTWAKTDDISTLVSCIIGLDNWSKGAIRKNTSMRRDDLDRLMILNRQVTETSAAQGVRYFGNLSTRCTNMFPSTRSVNGIIVSPRNSDKTALERKDMVLVTKGEAGELKYIGGVKPSVDSPVQVELYKQLTGVNFFIHGHRQIKNVPTTESYYPCGDLREVPEIVKLIGNNYFGAINLKNHGFLLYASDIKELKLVVDSIEFTDPGDPEK